MGVLAGVNGRQRRVPARGHGCGEIVSKTQDVRLSGVLMTSFFFQSNRCILSRLPCTLRSEFGVDSGHTTSALIDQEVTNSWMFYGDAFDGFCALIGSCGILECLGVFMAANRGFLSDNASPRVVALWQYNQGQVRTSPIRMVPR